MNNYEFCVQWILENKTEANVRVLDYGCGGGGIVKDLRKRGIDAFGCDVFYEGGDHSKDIDPALFGSVIRRMGREDCIIPFDNESFDFVINNQVMEHVENLDSVLAEIQRVLKPGSRVMSLFGYKGMWREGHRGIPFLHWFPKGNRLRVYYAATLRILGLGFFKGRKGVMRWSQDSCEWLDKWTYYRTRGEIDSAFDRYLCDIKHLEVYWLHRRLGRRKLLACLLPASVQQFAARRLGGLVVVARKPV